MFNGFDLLFAIVTAIGVFAFISVVGVWFVKRQKASKLEKLRFGPKYGFPNANLYETKCGFSNAHMNQIKGFPIQYRICSFVRRSQQT
jgi:hypothetical protein